MAVGVAVALLLAVACGDRGSGSSSTSGPLPVATRATVGANLDPETPPPGANRWSCEPSDAHPRPVVLVHGTFANQHANWTAVSPLLVNEGYCVFTRNYGRTRFSPVYGVGDIRASAEELRGFVDKVLARTRAEQVDIVGHFQGGLMPRYYLKELGGASKVHAL